MSVFKDLDDIRNSMQKTLDSVEVIEEIPFNRVDDILFCNKIDKIVDEVLIKGIITIEDLVLIKETLSKDNKLLELLFKKHKGNFSSIDAELHTRAQFIALNKLIKEDYDRKIEGKKEGYKTIRLINKIQKYLNEPYNQIPIKKIYEYIDKIFDYWENAKCIPDDNPEELPRDTKEYLLETINEYLEKLRIEYEHEVEKKKKEVEEKRMHQEQTLKQIEELTVETVKVEEPPIHINNFDKIKDVYDEFENLLPMQIYSEVFEEFYDEESIKGLLLFTYKELDFDQFHEALKSIFYKLHFETDEEIISRYHNYMYELCRRYDVRERILYTDNLISKMWGQFYNEDSIVHMRLSVERTNLDYLFNNNLDYSIADQTLDKIKKNLHDIRISLANTKKDNIELRSFIVFDYNYNESGEEIPYIINDLDENSNKSLIDRSIEKNKLLIDGYNDFCDLVEDLLANGEPKANEGQSRLVRPVYYTKSEYDYIVTGMDKATGMIRIRPTLDSFVRFVDERLIFDPSNQTKMNQIKNLIESKFKNVHIDETKPFYLYINILTSFKKKDGSVYKLAIKRQNVSPYRDLIDSFNKKEVLSNEDLELISDGIDLSMLAYKKLKEINENFGFQTINSIKSVETLR